MSLYTSTNLYDIKPEWYFRFISKEKSEFLINKLEELGYSLKMNPVLPPPAPYNTYQYNQYLYNQSYDTRSKSLMKFEIAADMYLNKRVNHLLDKYVKRSEEALYNPEEQDMYIRFCEVLGNYNQKMQNKEYDKSKIGNAYGSENPFEEKFNNMAVLPSRAYIENTGGFEAYFTKINDKYALANSAFTPLDGLYSAIENLLNSLVMACKGKWNKAFNHLLKTVEDVFSIPSYFFGYLKDSVLIGIGQYENVNRDPTARFWVNLATKVTEEVVMAFVTAGIGNAVKSAKTALDIAMKSGVGIKNAKNNLKLIEIIEHIFNGPKNVSSMLKEGTNAREMIAYSLHHIGKSIDVDINKSLEDNIDASLIELLKNSIVEGVDIGIGYPRTLKDMHTDNVITNTPYIFNRNKNKYPFFDDVKGVNPNDINKSLLEFKGMGNITNNKFRSNAHAYDIWNKSIDGLTKIYDNPHYRSLIKLSSSKDVNFVGKNIVKPAASLFLDEHENNIEYDKEKQYQKSQSLDYDSKQQVDVIDWSTEGMQESLREKQPHLFDLPPTKVYISGDFRPGILTQNISNCLTVE